MTLVVKTGDSPNSFEVTCDDGSKFGFVARPDGLVEWSLKEGNVASLNEASDAFRFALQFGEMARKEGRVPYTKH